MLVRKDQFLKLRIDPITAQILNRLAEKTYRSKAMTVRFLIREAGKSLEGNIHSINKEGKNEY